MPYRYLRDMDSGKILMLYTGGTIGMIQNSKTGALRPFNFEGLLDHIPELKTLKCSIDTDAFDEAIDSSDINPQLWLRLAYRIHKDYDQYDGFVILHGSDTMAYTASALSFMLENLTKPVILTGSLLPIGIARSDARENLITSVDIASARRLDGSAQVPEVAVYFENDLFRGNRVHKFSSEDFEAFRSFNYPKLAEVGVNIKYNLNAIAHAPTESPICCNELLNPMVNIVTLFPGMSKDILQPQLENEALSGIILRTYGSGNAPQDLWFTQMISDAQDRGVMVVSLSQCNEGGMIPGKYESSQKLAEIGVISAYDMTLEAGLTKMMYLLSYGWPYGKFKEYYENSLRGELTR